MENSSSSSPDGEGPGGSMTAPVVRGSVAAGEIDQGTRLDTFLSSHSGLSRNRAQKLIGEGRVLVDGQAARKNHLVSAGEKVTWELPPSEPEEVVPQTLPVTVVFEDEYLVVVDKPADMVMYPGPGHPSDTLLNALLALYPDISGVGGRGRPGVFHRLDRGTSGLVTVARTEESYLAMVEKMSERQVERTYIALVVGSVPAETGTIDAPMGRSRGNRKRMSVDRTAGRRAVSRFKVTERFGNDFTLVEVSLETGRTHQIRVHFTHIGHPVAGDPEYSRGRASRRLGLDRQFLHAFRLKFEHPFTGESLEFTAGLPEDLCLVLEELRREY
jgi:23S rRNA pseudouridine1911/1915/1917 synthase